MRTPEQIRLEAGLMLQQLADRANVSKSTISRLEKGQTMRLQPLPLQKIAVALKKHFEERGQKFDPATYIAATIAIRDSARKGAA